MEWCGGIFKKLSKKDMRCVLGSSTNLFGQPLGSNGFTIDSHRNLVLFERFLQHLGLSHSWQ